ncbi:MAG: SRPBCC family protein, partial [Betaproteobacteria bacterium AqS2]|nr:SRPBCC family protein [Betaproteobacteria bacterium AqS2]
PAALQAGGWHSWDSPKIGTGKLTNAELDAPRRAIQRLEFVKPFKSQAKVTWTFADDGQGGTKVTWRIDSGMPFVMRWMNRRMVRWLRSDFGCGLLRLRHLIDPSQPTMKFSFDGPCERPALRCVGRAFKGSIEDMKKEMGQHFDALSKLRKEGGAVVTRTDSFDQGNETIAVTYGVEPAEGASPPAGAAPFEVAGGKYHKVTCTGSYDYMEYAWHQSFGSVQMNKHKFDKSRQGYELYVKGPAETDGPDGYVTEILLPIK